MKTMKTFLRNQEIIDAFERLEKCKCLTKKEKSLLIEFIKEKAVEEYKRMLSPFSKGEVKK